MGNAELAQVFSSNKKLRKHGLRWFCICRMGRLGQASALSAEAWRRRWKRANPSPLSKFQAPNLPAGRQVPNPKQIRIDFTAHKTFVSAVLLNNYVPMEIVSEILGHSSIKITQEYYGKVVQTRISQEMKRISKIIT